jgi:hypothetical protein
MRYMIIVKATAQSEQGLMPPQRLLDEMAAYHEELAQAGLLIDGSGLQPSSKGWRIHYDGERRSVVDGPFAETREVIAGYTIIRADSPEQALAWSRRFPNPSIDGGDAEIEVRQMFELEDFEPATEVERFRAIGIAGDRVG